MADAFRWLALFLDLAAFGSLVALWDRVGRFILPRAAARLFFSASLLFLISIALEIKVRFGHPFTYRSLIEAITLTLYLLGLLKLYQWFATEAGRRKRHEVINEFAAHELLKVARLARALEEDPEHVGRYVGSPWYAQFVRVFYSKHGEHDGD